MLEAVYGVSGYALRILKICQNGVSGIFGRGFIQPPISCVFLNGQSSHFGPLFCAAVFFFFICLQVSIQDFFAYSLRLYNLFCSKTQFLLGMGFHFILDNFRTLGALVYIQSQLLEGRCFLFFIASLRSNTIANSKPASVRVAWLPLPCHVDFRPCAARVIAKEEKL